MKKITRPRQAISQRTGDRKVVTIYALINDLEIVCSKLVLVAKALKRAERR
jgi:hypothetical protein